MYSILCCLVFLEAENSFIGTQKCPKSSDNCVLILSKKQQKWLIENFHNSGMVGNKKLLDLWLNGIFNTL